MEIMIKNNVEKLGEYDIYKTCEKQDQKMKSMYIWLDGVEVSQRDIVLRKVTEMHEHAHPEGTWHIKSKLDKN